jgi:hypothetical protein
MKQFFDTGSPYLNMLNGFAESMKTNSPHEMLDGVDDEDFEGEGLAILRSAVAVVEKRKKQSKSNQDIDEKLPTNRQRG